MDALPFVPRIIARQLEITTLYRACIFGHCCTFSLFRRSVTAITANQSDVKQIRPVPSRSVWSPRRSRSPRSSGTAASYISPFVYLFNIIFELRSPSPISPSAAADRRCQFYEVQSDINLARRRRAAWDRRERDAMDAADGISGDPGRDPRGGGRIRHGPSRSRIWSTVARRGHQCQQDQDDPARWRPGASQGEPSIESPVPVPRSEVQNMTKTVSPIPRPPRTSEARSFSLRRFLPCRISAMVRRSRSEVLWGLAFVVFLEFFTRYVLHIPSAGPKRSRGFS